MERLYGTKALRISGNSADLLENQKPTADYQTQTHLLRHFLLQSGDLGPDFLYRHITDSQSPIHRHIHFAPLSWIQLRHFANYSVSSCHS